MRATFKQFQHTLTAVCAIVLMFAMASCGGSGGDANLPGGIQGVAQKGPFIKGSRVFIQELDTNLNPTGISYETTTTDDQGRFDLESTLGANLVEVSITGYYFNEVTGTLSQGPQTLRMITDLSRGSGTNVNVLTQLSVARIRALVAAGKTIDEASTQAKSEVLGLFNIDPAMISGDLESLDLASAGVANASLLYASAVLLQGRTEAETALLLAELELDMEQNGTVDNPLLLQQVDQGKASVSLNAILNNLTSYYVGIGSDITPPDVIAFEVEMDQIPPQLLGFTPQDGAVEVAVDSSLEILFSEALDPATLVGNILLKNASGAITCALSTHGNKVNLVPASQLAYSTAYTLEVRTGLTDLGGNLLQTGGMSSFVTKAAPDLVAPYLVGSLPSDGMLEVPINGILELTFSEDLQPASINGAVTFSNGSTSVAVMVDVQGATLRVVPMAPLAMNQTYWLSVGQQITDLSGNALVSAYQISFTTQRPVQPSCGLYVMAFNPGEDQGNISVHRALTLHFNLDIERTSINHDSLWLYGPEGVVHGRISVDDNVISFKPFRDLKYNTTYELHLKAVRSESGETLCGEQVFGFTTRGGRVRDHEDHE